MRKKQFLKFFLTAFGLVSLAGVTVCASDPTTRPAPSPAAVAPGTGSLTGTLNFPSEVIPPMIVVAYPAGDTSKFQKVETAQKQSTFTISNLAPGSYVVVAYPKSDDPLQGGYTQAVPCGLMANCKDHSLIPVKVEAGKITKGVEVKDWYAPDNAFPPKPK